MAADTDSTFPVSSTSIKHAGGVVDEGTEPSHVTAGDLPAATLGEVPYRQHHPSDIGILEEAAAHDLHETPPSGARTRSSRGVPDVFALNARQGHNGQLVVVGMDEIEHARAGHVVQVQLEQCLRRRRWPTSGALTRR